MVSWFLSFAASRAGASSDGSRREADGGATGSVQEEIKVDRTGVCGKGAVIKVDVEAESGLWRVTCRVLCGSPRNELASTGCRHPIQCARGVNIEVVLGGKCRGRRRGQPAHGHGVGNRTAFDVQGDDSSELR